MRRYSHLWPWVAAPLFWVGALVQIRLILVSGTAGSVSALQWFLSTFILYGFALFYSIHLDKRARLNGIITSCVSGTLYAVITTLAILY